MDGQGTLRTLSRCDEINLRVVKGAKNHLMGRNERGERRVGGLKPNTPYCDIPRIEVKRLGISGKCYL